MFSFLREWLPPRKSGRPSSDPKGVPEVKPAPEGKLPTPSSLPQKNTTLLELTLQWLGAWEDIKKSVFQIIFFLFSLCICCICLNKISSLSALYFSGGLLQKLADYRDWHVLAAADVTFAGLTAIFITIFLTISTFVASISKTAVETGSDESGEPADLEQNRNIPKYILGIITALKDLFCSIKGSSK